ncbi:MULTISPECIES: hypothetical protein [unclassified Arthrobacter]|uniref:hypothetical protein n=1 Tax=unclassified Arthrobacter TaxID=235627 RepID=UPI002106314D|nr:MULTISPECIES: hypothetical protein [unclassified Arthrobacter]MCQ1946118.1 hypothetical protein [Arthrobacter sp. zg-Y1116]MCQ1986056.1 hypothetical protein [Arthrobacter sp. zg-Y844]MCQ1994201.1 hypothetical protein [Arthrobacter sp. zg-Y1171]UWX81699.1 hypothetical protein N2L00_15140 [Arthrobacter sp. zg-Y1171]
MSTPHPDPQNDHYPYPTTAESGDRPPASAQFPSYPASAQLPGGRAAGEGFKNQSLLFGVLGLFVAGFVLGPMAIYYAQKAEALNVPATAGKVLGWVNVVMCAITVAIFQTLIYFLVFAAVTGFGGRAI